MFETEEPRSREVREVPRVIHLWILEPCGVGGYSPVCVVECVFYHKQAKLVSPPKSPIITLKSHHNPKK